MTTGHTPALPPAGFDIVAPEASEHREMPLVLASPHSGRHYPQSFLRQSRLGREALRRSEDAYVDRLFAGAPALGVPLVVARYARSYVDLNREPLELDPTMFSDALPAYANATSPRVRAGLGTVPRIGANGAEIYRGPLRYGEARQRVRHIYLPYHRALKRLLAETRDRFGLALLVDCHSMPSQAALAAAGRARRFAPTERARNAPDGSVDVILGDCHGTSCLPAFTDRAEAALTALGYSVARNHPYAGGFTTRHHGRPEMGFHALQIEINRSLYMDERRLARLPRFEAVAADMMAVVAALGDQGALGAFSRAAE